MKFTEAISKANKNEVVSEAFVQLRVFKYDNHDVIYRHLNWGKYTSKYWRIAGLSQLSPYDIIKSNDWGIFPDDKFNKNGIKE